MTPSQAALLEASIESINCTRNDVLINYFLLENDIECQISSQLIRKTRNGKKPKVKNYVKDVVPHYIEDDFRSHFRVSRSTVEFLLNLIGNKNGFSYNERGLGRPCISPKIQLLLFLDYMGHESYQYQLETKYGVSVGAVNHIVHKLTAFFVTTLSEEFIKWPTEEEAKNNAQFLHEKYVNVYIEGNVRGLFIFCLFLMVF